jgi:hypothetical protein
LRVVLQVVGGQPGHLGRPQRGFQPVPVVGFVAVGKAGRWRRGGCIRCRQRRQASAHLGVFGDEGKLRKLPQQLHRVVEHDVLHVALDQAKGV